MQLRGQLCLRQIEELGVYWVKYENFITDSEMAAYTKNLILPLSPPTCVY